MAWLRYGHIISCSYCNSHIGFRRGGRVCGAGTDICDRIISLSKSPGGFRFVSRKGVDTDIPYAQALRRNDGRIACCAGFGTQTSAGNPVACSVACMAGGEAVPGVTRAMPDRIYRSPTRFASRELSIRWLPPAVPNRNRRDSRYVVSTGWTCGACFFPPRFNVGWRQRVKCCRLPCRSWMSVVPLRAGFGREV